MQDPKPQIEIVEYNKQYASTDQIKKFFFENYDQQMNSNSFKGVYISMRAKYGKLVYGFLIMSALQFCGIVYLILAYATEWSTIVKTILSIILGGALEYSLFGVLLVKHMNKPHIHHGYEMLSNFDDIDARYKKNGGNFWFALLHNPKTGTKELVGQLGFVKSDSPAKSAHLEALGVDTKYRGLGIGRRLMEKAINYAEERKIESLTLGVLAVNTAGVNLYKKFGFNIVKTFEIEPLTGLSVHMMSKRLN